MQSLKLNNNNNNTAGQIISQNLPIICVLKNSETRFIRPGKPRLKSERTGEYNKPSVRAELEQEMQG